MALPEPMEDAVAALVGALGDNPDPALVAQVVRLIQQAAPVRHWVAVPGVGPEGLPTMDSRVAPLTPAQHQQTRRWDGRVDRPPEGGTDGTQ